MIVWGIDPGVYGAVGMLKTDSHGPCYAAAIPLPYHRNAIDLGFRIIDLSEANALIYALESHSPPDMVVFETPLQTMAKGGRTSATAKTLASTWFNFGRLYSAFERECDCPLLFITAREWKKWAGLGKDKGESVQMMRDRFGHLISDVEMAGLKQQREGQAEALLIAQYGLTVYGDKL